MWKPKNLSWKLLGQRVWQNMQADDTFGRSAALAYYFFFALFPMLIFLTALFGIFAARSAQLQAGLTQSLTRALPPDASAIIQRFLGETLKSSGGGKLSFGIIAALWSASAGMSAIMDALNTAYQVKESRSFMARKFTAVWLTIAMAALVLVAFVVVLFGNSIASWIGGATGLSGAATLAWKIVQWPVALAFIVVAFGLIYRFAPNLKNPHWEWITPGAALGVFIWLIAAFALRVYLHFFNSYSATYGSLGAVMILLLWFYVTGVAILIGGEINFEVARVLAERGHPAAKAEGPGRQAASGERTLQEADSQEPGKRYHPAGDIPHPRRAA